MTDDAQPTEKIDAESTAPDATDETVAAAAPVGPGPVATTYTVPAVRAGGFDRSRALLVAACVAALLLAFVAGLCIGSRDGRGDGRGGDRLMMRGGSGAPDGRGMAGPMGQRGDVSGGMMGADERGGFRGAPGGRMGGHGGTMGVVTSVSDDAIQLNELRSGDSVTVRIDDETDVHTRDQQDATVDDLAEGMVVAVRATDDDRSDDAADDESDTLTAADIVVLASADSNDS